MAIAILLLGIWLGGHPSVLPGPLRGAFFQDNPNRLEDQVLGSSTQNYYRPLKRSALVDKGLAAMVASLGDPYSHYFAPTDYRAFNQSDPHLSGIGIDVLLDPTGCG